MKMLLLTLHSEIQDACKSDMQSRNVTSLAHTCFPILVTF